MKLLIASDIHGSAYYNDQLLTIIRSEEPDKILLLGDILYHGPRNDLPEGYVPKKVFRDLNGLKEKIICVRGNCDSEVDQMVLEFPIMAPYCYLNVDDLDIWMTHGHIYNQNNVLPGCRGILLCGHTHVPALEECGDFTYINPGSVSLPKEGTPHSYMIYEDKRFLWKDLTNMSVYREYVIV